MSKSWTNEEVTTVVERLRAMVFERDAEVRDLKARLKAMRQLSTTPVQGSARGYVHPCADAITNLRNKNWRKARGAGR